ncbi:MAG: adenylate kinase [Elusimicrobia bacterium]|nr:adenylate kinase [Elusimicrobiota bacterium]MBU2614374.1 adenylate kinase [Elusimicrobiota bacterium]
MNIILLGAPGSGKGTQAANIIKEYKIPHVSTGDLFRGTLKKNTKISREIRKFVNKGALVPDDIVIDMFKRRVEKSDCRKGFISDGFPRNLFQAKILDRYFQEKSKKIDAVLFLNLSSAESLKRLTARWLCPSCNRGYNMISQPPKADSLCDVCKVKLVQRIDDTPQTVKRRLKIYKVETCPIVNYYKKQKKLFTIQADKKIEKIFKDIKRALNKIN